MLFFPGIPKGKPWFSSLFVSFLSSLRAEGCIGQHLTNYHSFLRSKKKGRNADRSMASQWNDQSSVGFFGPCPPLNSGFPLGNELGPISSGKASCFAFQKVLVLTSTLVAQRLLCKSSQNLFCSTCGNKSESPWVIQWSNVAVTWSTIQVELELIQFSSNPLELNIPTRGIGRAWSVFFFALVGSLKSSAPSTLCTPASYSGAVVQPKKNTGTASKNGEKPWWMVNFLENIQPFSGYASVVGHTQIL